MGLVGVGGVIITCGVGGHVAGCDEESLWGSRLGMVVWGVLWV